MLLPLRYYLALKIERCQPMMYFAATPDQGALPQRTAPSAVMSRHTPHAKAAND
jgi:hypothetical protein